MSSVEGADMRKIEQYYANKSNNKKTCYTRTSHFIIRYLSLPGRVLLVTFFLFERRVSRCYVAAISHGKTTEDEDCPTSCLFVVKLAERWETYISDESYMRSLWWEQTSILEDRPWGGRLSLAESRYTMVETTIND